MRYLILIVLFFAANCSQHYDQQNTDNYSQIDTAKLFDPKPELDSAVENADILNHCLMLDGDKMKIVLNEQNQELRNIKELSEFLSANSTIIEKQKFYIIYHNGTAVKNIIEIIDVTKEAKIDNYKVVNLQRLFRLNEPK